MLAARCCHACIRIGLRPRLSPRVASLSCVAERAAQQTRDDDERVRSGLASLSLLSSDDRSRSRSSLCSKNFVLLRRSLSVSTPSSHAQACARLRRAPQAASEPPRGSRSYLAHAPSIVRTDLLSRSLSVGECLLAVPARQLLFAAQTTACFARRSDGIRRRLPRRAGSI